MTVKIGIKDGVTSISKPSPTRIPIPDEGIETLLGTYDENLKDLAKRFDVKISTD